MPHASSTRARPRATRLAALAALSALVLLAGCFDGDEDPPAPTADSGVPASATASGRAYTQFAASLPLDDRATPRTLDGVEPPTSETAEPEPVR